MDVIEFSEMFDLVTSLVFAILPFMGLLFGLVQFLKTILKLEGNAVYVLEFVVGVVLFLLFYIAYIVPEARIYVVGFLFVIGGGLSTSGFYKFYNERNPKL